MYSIFRPFIFSNTAICVFRVIGTGSRLSFLLSSEFNQRGILGALDRSTHVLGDAHILRRWQVVCAVCVRTPGRSEAGETEMLVTAHQCYASAEPHSTAQFCWDFLNMTLSK